MKFKKSIQGLVEVITVGALLLILTTIESEWNLEYLKFVGLNATIFITGALLLLKFGSAE